MKMVTLDEVCELIVDCEHKTAPKQASGYPSIRTPNIGRGYFILENVNRVSRETYEKWTQRAVPQYGDLIIAREAPVGNVAMVPKGLEVCLGQRTVLIRPDQTKTDPKFLTYLLLGDEVQGSIHSQTNGATVAHLNMRDIRSLKLPYLPDLPSQRKIAGILSAYDDLIENNLRRIKILEEMAQSLYSEWFVHFRFPGHESASFTDSSLGRIPKGWNVKSVETVLKRLKSGTVYKKNDVSDSGVIPVIDQSTDLVLGFHGNNPDHQASARSPIAIFGDHTCKIQLMTEPFSIGPNVIPFVAADDLPLFYVYFLIRDLASTQEYKRHWIQLTSNEVAVATKEIAERFRTFVQPIFEQFQLLQNQNQNLRRTRDLLLPKLLSP